jgi:hypothetical protein
MTQKMITEQRGHLTVKRLVTEAVEKGALAKFMKELPKGPVAAKIRKGFEKWLKSHADPKLTHDEFIRAWNAEVKKAEEFDDLPMDKASDLYL